MTDNPKSEKIRASIIIFESKRRGQFITNAKVFHGHWWVETAAGWVIVNDERRAA